MRKRRKSLKAAEHRHGGARQELRWQHKKSENNALQNLFISNALRRSGAGVAALKSSCSEGGGGITQYSIGGLSAGGNGKSGKCSIMKPENRRENGGEEWRSVAIASASHRRHRQCRRVSWR
jgi:hypothetical protein